MRQYIVLCKNGDGGWHEIGEVEAASPINAAEQLAKGAGTFAAVADGNILEVEQVTTLKARRRSVAEVS